MVTSNPRCTGHRRIWRRARPSSHYGSRVSHLLALYAGHASRLKTTK
jgi:hypothetical protein